MAALWAFGGPEQRAAPRVKPKAAATTTPLPESAAPGPVNEPIAMGDRGGAVRALQQTLIVLGAGTPGADGSFEGATRDAVFAFQQAHGLTADGVVGPETAGALRGALAERATSVAADAREGLRSAVGAQRLSAEAGSQYEAILDRALEDFGDMPLAGAANLAVVLDDVASQSSVYDEPRALALFGMLEANREHLKANEPPQKPTDITGPDGVVYRFFPTRGFQFHPLANFAALNGHVSKGHSADAQRLATALVARGRPGRQGARLGVLLPLRRPEPLDVRLRPGGRRGRALAHECPHARPEAGGRGEGGISCDPERAFASNRRRLMGPGVRLQRHRDPERTAANDPQHLSLCEDLGDADARAFAAGSRPPPETCCRGSTRAAGRSTRSAVGTRRRRTTGTTSGSLASSPRRTRVGPGAKCPAAGRVRADGPPVDSAPVHGITEAVTSFIGDYGLYAVFFLSFVDAVLPAASEVVMVYGGALAAGAFPGSEVSLFGITFDSTWEAYLAIAIAGTVGYVLGSVAGLGHRVLWRPASAHPARTVAARHARETRTRRAVVRPL